MSGLPLAGLEYDFTRDFIDSVTVAMRTSVAAGGGKATYGPKTTYQCRVERMPHMVRTIIGEQIVASTRVFFPSNIGLSPHDRITFDDGEQPMILAIESQKNEYGSYLYTVHT